MKPTKSILILLSLLLISNCGDKVREEITERYDDGKKKTIMKFKGSGSEEVMVEKIGYSQSGDTLIWENYDSKGERDGNWIGYVDDYFVEGNFKDGKLDGKVTSYYENGQIEEEENYKDDELVITTYYSYHENGQIKEEGNWIDGEKDGKWICYYKSES